MGERRQDRLTGEWVIVAPSRRFRPHAYSSRTKAPGPAHPLDPSCPFCPGNEAQLTEIIQEARTSTSPGWATRIVANKYPIVEISSEKGMAAIGGHHQVIIETPRHNIDLADISDADMELVIQAYREREEAFRNIRGIRSVIIFRNHLGSAGASIEHPHSQVIALNRVPPHIQAVKQRAHAFYKRTGHCLLCDIASKEARQGERLIADNDGFTAFIPYAATAPFETWIVPKCHNPCLRTIGRPETEDLAAILRRSLVALRTALDDPPYSYVIETFQTQGKADPALHWRLRIVPKVTISAGFELGSGISVNPSSPEADAAALKTAFTWN